MKLFSATFSIALSVAGVLGCRPVENPVTPALTVKASIDATLAPTIIPLEFVPAQPSKYPADRRFDWETARYMPAPTNGPRIPMPWSNEASRAFSDDIRQDYRKADGWELLYTGSSPDYLVPHQYLFLYNKYRGLLRLYYYFANDPRFIADNNVLTQKLSILDGVGDSPLLNFAEQPVVDVAKNARSYATIEPQPIAQRTWYVVQSEVAYDRRLAGQRANSPLAIGWDINSDQVNLVTLNGGRLRGTLPTALHAEGVDFTIDATFTGMGQLLVSGQQALSALRSDGQNVSRIEQSLAQNSTGDVLSGIIAPSVSSLIRQPALVRLTKTVGRRAPLIAPWFNLPGSDFSLTVGVGPAYNEVLGVFYLENAPVVTTQTRARTTLPYVYALDVASVRYLFNPAVTALANIRNIRQEIVATAVGGASEQNPAMQTLFVGTTLEASAELNIVGVRVSFDVVPKNGAPVVRIVKTFKPTTEIQ